MLRFPAITFLALLDALLLLAIAIAPLVRLRRLRRLRQTSSKRALGVPAFRPAALPRPGDLQVRDDLALCGILSGLDRRARNTLLASLDRNQPIGADVLALAADRNAESRLSAIRLLGTTCDLRARRMLAMLLGDADPAVRRVSAAAAAWSARVGYPRPLDEALVDRLLETLDRDPAQVVVAEAIGALTYSLDPRVPAAFLRHIPSSGDSIREHLVESSALFAHLLNSVERRHMAEGAGDRTC
jgi:hypothetical protein